MYCPECGAEWQPGFTACPQCDVPLTEDPPSAPTPLSAPELEPVFISSSSEALVITKSILHSAGIDFVVHGEQLQDMFAWGRFPSGYNVFMGPMRVLVSVDRASEARDLLASTPEPNWDAGPDSEAPDTEARDAGYLWRNAKPIARLLSALVLTWFAIEILLGVLLPLWQ